MLFPAMPPNHFQHALNILKNIIVPKPENLETMPRQTTISLFILLFACGVLPTIEFDNEPFLIAHEINDEFFNRFLASELDSLHL